MCFRRVVKPLSLFETKAAEVNSSSTYCFVLLTPRVFALYSISPSREPANALMAHSETGVRAPIAARRTSLTLPCCIDGTVRVRRPRRQGNHGCTAGHQGRLPWSGGVGAGPAGSKAALGWWVHANGLLERK